MNIMDINAPEDIKSLSIDELENFNEDIRNFLIESISKTGGHLGSSLGTVDLITALHFVFNSPTDKFIFDVGHQAYAHKILTGRANKFSTLRQYNGLSGFLKKEESIHDVWESGHAANSISAAIGYAMKRDLDKTNNHIIAIIGDGSMTNGMSLEALNHLIELNTKLIVIINDNEMSISPNIGFIDNIFKSLEFNRPYDNTKQAIKYSIKKIDSSNNLYTTIKSFKNKVKTEINQTKGFFNLLGFKYLGPIDGHDMKSLISTFEKAKTYDNPLIIHVKTIKGKGYLPAENNSWHAVPKFNIKTGEIFKNSNISNSSIICNTLLQLMEKDKDIVIVNPAMIEGSKLNEIQNTFPNRITDVGIAEEHATSLSAGLALAGKKPFLSIYSTFLQRSYDQVFQDIVRQNTDVVIGIDRAGLVGEDGETHHGIYDLSFLLHMPNITIIQGKDAKEMQNLLYNAFVFKGPVFLRYSKHALYDKNILIKQYDNIPYGTWETLTYGTKINIISYGEDVLKILDIYKDVEEVGVINARFIKPVDATMLKEISNKPIIVLEESARIGGLGNYILNFYNEAQLNTNIQILAIGDHFVQHGSIDELKVEQKIDIKYLQRKVFEIISKS